MNTELSTIESCRAALESIMNRLIVSIGDIQIGTNSQFPLGWRRAGKGRTVWRLLEEALTQNLEVQHRSLGIANVFAVDSEVGIFDMQITLNENVVLYANIKSAVSGGRSNKDDISKARLLEQFFAADPTRILLIATIHISFLESMHIRLDRATVVPVSWLPDIYVNPSNNANLQSSQYKSTQFMIPRTGVDFLELLRCQIAVANEKRRSRNA